MIPNLPDLGLAPLAGEHSDGLSLLTAAHNSLLADALDDLSARLYGVNIILADMFTVSQNMLDGSYDPKLPPFVTFPPALAVVSPGTGAVDCLFRNPTTCPDVNLIVPTAKQQPYFWDVLHPTTAAHDQLGKAMFDTLTK
jgi:phospholipase/lecithinase/hemolysin